MKADKVCQFIFFANGRTYIYILLLFPGVKIAPIGLLCGQNSVD